MTITYGDTTDLHILRTTPERFTWGRILKFMDIGEYTFAEYIPEDEAATEFWGWASGEHYSISWATIDEALIGLIAHKYGNGRAAPYIGKMIGMGV